MKRKGSAAATAAGVSQEEIARVKRVREVGIELQRIALDLAQSGEQDISRRVLDAALRSLKARARAVEPVPQA